MRGGARGGDEAMRGAAMRATAARTTATVVRATMVDDECKV
jgi:hypothetical protein